MNAHNSTKNEKREKLITKCDRAPLLERQIAIKLDIIVKIFVFYVLFIFGWLYTLTEGVLTVIFNLSHV
jgi:hypothetical protein